jgi:hypothetical protein
MPLSKPLKRVVAAEALAWVADVAGVVADETERGKAEVLAAEEYDVAEYAARIVVADKARQVLRGIAYAIRTGRISNRWDRSDDLEQLITTGLGQYDPRIAFQAGLRSAYAAGREDRIADDDETTHKVYRTMRDDRVRDSHEVLDGLCLEKGHKDWNVLSAPNGWRCRCKCYGVDREGIERLEKAGVKLQFETPEMDEYTYVNKATGKSEALPVAVEPGWGTKPGSDANKKAMAAMLMNRMRLLTVAPADDL